MSLTYREFSEINKTRTVKFGPIEAWDINQWLVAMVGEIGEACNNAKKINRITAHYKTRPTEADVYELRQKLINELADVDIYLDLIYTYLGVSRERAIARKFNATSDEMGFPDKVALVDSDGDVRL